MADYQIVCVDKAPSPSGAHQHIVQAGTTTTGGSVPTRQWSVADVVRALSAGDTFYSTGGTGRRARVSSYPCTSCGKTYIRTHPDDTLIDNLDNLRRCS